MVTRQGRLVSIGNNMGRSPDEIHVSMKGETLSQQERKGMENIKVHAFSETSHIKVEIQSSKDGVHMMEQDILKSLELQREM